MGAVPRAPYRYRSHINQDKGTPRGLEYKNPHLSAERTPLLTAHRSHKPVEDTDTTKCHTEAATEDADAAKAAATEAVVAEVATAGDTAVGIAEDIEGDEEASTVVAVVATGIGADIGGEEASTVDAVVATEDEEVSTAAGAVVVPADSPLERWEGTSSPVLAL